MVYLKKKRDMVGMHKHCRWEIQVSILGEHFLAKKKNLCALNKLFTEHCLPTDNLGGRGWGGGRNASAYHWSIG